MTSRVHSAKARGEGRSPARGEEGRCFPSESLGTAKGCTRPSLYVRVIASRGERVAASGGKGGAEATQGTADEMLRKCSPSHPINLIFTATKYLKQLHKKERFFSTLTHPFRKKINK